MGEEGERTKRHLYAILQGVTPSLEVLRTALYEVAAILNQAPLIPVSDSIDSYEALTHAHFLLQKPSILLMPVGTEQDYEHSRAKWKAVCALKTPSGIDG